MQGCIKHLWPRLRGLRIWGIEEFHPNMPEISKAFSNQPTESESVLFDDQLSMLPLMLRCLEDEKDREDRTQNTSQHNLNVKLS